MIHNKVRIFITGISGILGTELSSRLKYYGVDYTGSDVEVDICNYNNIKNVIDKSKTNIVINCAAIIDVPKCEIKKQLAYDINYCGAINVAKAVKELKIDKMVQISSDYVYDGNKQYEGDGKEGNYKIGDYLNPINYYAFTKTLADVAIQNLLEHFLVCRLSFKKKGAWPYDKAFIDQYTSRDTVDVIAEQIIQATFNEQLNGIIHLGTERKRVWDLAVRQSPEIEKISINDIKSVVLPKDTSLKLTKIRKVI